MLPLGLNLVDLILSDLLFDPSVLFFRELVFQAVDFASVDLVATFGLGVSACC